VALAVFVAVELLRIRTGLGRFVCSAIRVHGVLSFVVGFSLLGALIFLPMFMQFVRVRAAITAGPLGRASLGGNLLGAVFYPVDWTGCLQRPM
jgi:hypothetical protein